METAIQWFYARLGKVTYSMVNRRGPNSYDCSSSVYFALIAQGIFPSSIYIGNTDTEFNDLEKYGFTQVKADAQGNVAAQRGDIFIWGKRGASTGSLGHTGIFINPDEIIHCSYGYNGIAVSNHDWLSAINGYPELTVYRKTKSPAPNPVDQEVEVGSFIKFPGTYVANDVQHVADLWQIKSDVLCPVGFTWEDNGIPAGPLVEVDASGKATKDQELDVNSKFVIPGKYQVLDVGQTNGRWLGQISWNGLSFWVDLEPAVEVSSSDAGTPTPAAAPVLDPPTPVVTAPVPPVVVQPTPTPAPTPTVDYAKENNDLLKKLWEGIKQIAARFGINL